MDAKLQEAYVEMIAETFRATGVTFGDNFPKFNNSGITKDGRNSHTVLQVSPRNFISVNMTRVAFNGSSAHELYFTHSDNPHDADSFSLERSGAGEALRVFNGVMQIAMEMVDRVGVESFFFDGYDPRLESLYRRLIDNGRFNEILEKTGFYYEGEHYYEDMVVFLFRRHRAGL